MTMHKVVSVKPSGDWKLEIAFADGKKGVVSIKESLFGPVFEPLKDPAYFAHVRIDSFGVVCWPNGADLGPNALYDQIKSTSGLA
jgi:hypothetical protein